jgi:hypothetical protein
MNYIELNGTVYLCSRGRLRVAGEIVPGRHPACPGGEGFYAVLPGQTADKDSADHYKDRHMALRCLLTVTWWKDGKGDL